MKLLFALALFIASSQTLANQNAIRGSIDAIRGTTNDVTYKLQLKTAEIPAGYFVNCGQPGNASQACADAYGDVYSKPVVKFTVSIGYTDVVQTFADRQFNFLGAEDSVRRQVWEEYLTASCDGGVGTCGFSRDPDDADLFTKTVVGPDGKDHKVELRLAHSAAGLSDAENRGAGSAQQRLQTRAAERNFYEHACESDGVIYAGHWRNGGGPSFAPPPLIAGTSNVNFAAFKTHDAEKRLLDVLKSCPKPPAIVALFACNASSASAAEVRNATKNRSGVITANGLTEPEVVYSQAFATLDSLLAMRCAPDFDRALNAIKNYRRTDGQGVQRVGFFGDSHPHFQCEEATEAAPPEGARAQTPLVDRPILPPGTGATKTPSVQGADSVK